MELLTFQKGSQPHVMLQDLLRQHKLEPKKVHAISSISAMMQLVQGGLWRRAAAARGGAAADWFLPVLKVLNCDVQPKALPIHASYRSDQAPAWWTPC